MQTAQGHSTEELLSFATAVARKVWNDIEAESAAGNALFRALRTYDGKTSVKGWVAYCVKVEVKDWWRRFHYTSGRKTHTLRHKADAFWVKIGAPAQDEVCEFQEDYPFYWTLLVERFVEKLPLDVLATRRGTTIKVVRQNIETGVELLKRYIYS